MTTKNNAFLTETEFMLMHSKFSGKSTRITVAGFYNPEEASLSLGVAKCFREDNFCRKTGRELAIGRLDFLGNKPTLKIAVKPESDIQEFFEETFNKIEKFLQREGLKKLKSLFDETELNKFEDAYVKSLEAQIN